MNSHATGNRKLKLPDEVKSEVSRIAYALAQSSYAIHRRRIELHAQELLRSGHAPADVITEIGRSELSGPAGAG